MKGFSKLRDQLSLVDKHGAGSSDAIGNDTIKLACVTYEEAHRINWYIGNSISGT